MNSTYLDNVAADCASDPAVIAERRELAAVLVERGPAFPGWEPLVLSEVRGVTYREQARLDGKSRAKLNRLAQTTRAALCGTGT